jgi:hypothetical protein
VIFSGGNNTYAYAAPFLASATANAYSDLPPKSNGAGGAGTTGTNSIGVGLSPSSLPANYVPVGAVTPALLISGLEFDVPAGTAGGSTTQITLANQTGTNFGSVDYYLTGTPGAYGDAKMTTASDTVNLAPATLNISVLGASSSSSSSSTSSSSTNPHHAIVTLASSAGALGGLYGSQLGATLNMIGGHGSYLPAYTGLISPAQTTGYAAASGFNPVTDTEVYALQLNYSGGVVSPSNTTLIAAIVSDINASSSNVSASAVTGVYASLFPTYDVLLTSTAGFTPGAGGVADLGIDFSQDTDAATPGLVVTEVAAVPEPATAAGAVLGAAGLLLGRRKKQAATA